MHNFSGFWGLMLIKIMLIKNSSIIWSDCIALTDMFMWQLVSGKMMLDAGMTSQLQPRFYSLRIASPIGQCRLKTTTETSFTRRLFQTHLLKRNHIKMACSASGFKYSKGSRTGLEFDSFISGSSKRKDTIQIGKYIHNTIIW